MTETAPARRLIYLSGTRADFGLMSDTLKRIAATPGLALQVAVTGMHLSPEHGNTVAEVRASGLPVCAEIPLDMSTRTGSSMAFGIADCLRGMTELLAREHPDFLVLLGDRGEMLAGAIAALHTGVACVHIHGGERSGTVDEPVRHAISKLSTYHLVATAGSRERLLRMGEDEARVFVTGAPGLDGLAELAAMSREDCVRAVGLPDDTPFVLVLFHPVVQQADSAAAADPRTAAGVGARGVAGAVDRTQCRCRFARNPEHAGSGGAAGGQPARDACAPAGVRGCACAIAPCWRAILPRASSKRRPSARPS